MKCIATYYDMHHTTNSTLFRYSDKIDRIIELYSLILYSLDKEKGAAYFEVHLSLLVSSNTTPFTMVLWSSDLSGGYLNQ